MSIKSTGENAYFVASNSSTGFISYYEEVFRTSRIGHIWAIKGGPGTGKSHFLREVSKRALDAGWACEYIYCSSDPNSLDAVILTHEGKEGIALLDATAPHLFEPCCPGAREDIINLGQFWNVDLLALRREEIEQLNREKGNAYRRAYRYLSGFGDMRDRQRYHEYEAMCQEIEQTVRESKMVATAVAAAQAASAAAPAAAPAPAPAPAPAGPKFCPNCGAPADGGKFCQSCGSKLA
jgi:hypothetical protein